MPEIDIVQFRQQRRLSPLLAYENLTSMPAAHSITAANDILIKGWKRRDYPTLLLSDDLPWSSYAQADRSWNFYLNCWDLLHDVLTAYSETGQRKYLEPALRVALDWVLKHPHVEPETQGAFAWYDMAVGFRAYRLSFLLDSAARLDWVSHGEIAHLFDSLELHRKMLADDKQIAFHNNHGLYQVAGQLAMARRFGAQSEDMDATLTQARERLMRMLDQQFTEEGVHREHSPDYHRMVCDTLRGILDANLLEDTTIAARIDQIERTLSWFVMPNGYLVNFGDSDYRRCSARSSAVLERWRTEEMRYAVTAGRVGHAPMTTTQAFEASGYFIVRDGAEYTASEQQQHARPFARQTYLAQIAAFHSRTHKHADDLSFVWSDHACEILVDAGRYGYLGKAEIGSTLWQQGFWYSDPNRVYCESTRAHNTVEIDGQSYPRKGVKPYGSAIQRWGQVNGGLHYCESEVRHFKSIRHARLLVLQPGSWLLVWDWLHDNADAEHDYRQWFHLSPELSVELERDQFKVSLACLDPPLRITSLLEPPRPLKPILGQEAPPRQGWWSPKERAIVPNYALGFEQRQRTGIFATLFSFAHQLEPDRSWSKANSSGRNVRLRWRADSVVHAVTLSRPEQGSLEIEYLPSASHI